MFLVGVAGGSGSGKTTFAKKILQRVNDPNLALLHQDSYYLPAPPPEIRVHGEPNFDHPEAFDWPLMQNQLERLSLGEQVPVPIYDYNVSRRTKETQQVGPCKALIMEGIFTLWDPAIRNLFDLRVFLHVEADIRFIRRLHRYYSSVLRHGKANASRIFGAYETIRGHSCG